CTPSAAFQKLPIRSIESPPIAQPGIDAPAAPGGSVCELFLMSGDSKPPFATMLAAATGVAPSKSVRNARLTRTCAAANQRRDARRELRVDLGGERGRARRADRLAKRIGGADALERGGRVAALGGEHRDILEQKRERPAVVVRSIRAEAVRVVPPCRGVVAQAP